MRALLTYAPYCVDRCVERAQETDCADMLLSVNVKN